MKERLLFILVVVALVVTVPVVYYLLFERGLTSVSTPEVSRPARPRELRVEPVEPEEQRPPVPVALSLTGMEGEVEILRPGGAWGGAEVGTVLGPRDRIRTGPAAKARLSMPGSFSVELDAASEFQVRSLAEDLNRFLLQQGMIAADVIDDPARRFEVGASDAVARTRGGSFRMNVDRAGMVSLGTSRGQVEVEAAGKVIQVREGHLTRIEKGEPPEDPIEIPARLALRVRWPRKKEIRSREVTIAGRTAPGARVRVEGTTVVVDAKGRFRHKLALSEGAHRLEVESYDVGGNRSQKKSPRLLVDTRPDAFRIRTSPEMWKKKKGKEGEKHP